MDSHETTTIPVRLDRLMETAGITKSKLLTLKQFAQNPRHNKNLA